MSQEIFANIDPTVTTGLMLAALLDDFKDAYCSGFSGTSRPTRLQAGGFWVDTSEQGEPTYSWTLKLYTGTTDLDILTLDVLTGQSGFNYAADTFTVRRVSADTTAAILNLTKARIDNSGQVLTDDVLGEFRLVGRTATGTDPVVAYLKATAADDMSSTEQGVVFSVYTTPAGSNTISEHLRFLNGIVESVKSHKLNSVIFGQDQIASAADLLISTDKMHSQITGTTESTVHGIEAVDGETKVKIILNSTTRSMFIIDESEEASAEERFSLPDDRDMTVPPEGSVTFYYCETSARWKFLYGVIQSVAQKNKVEINGGYWDWTAPVTGRIKVLGYQDGPDNATVTSAFGMGMYNPFSWGRNQNGQLGLGDVTSRSSPVAVLGGLNLVETRIGATSSYARAAYEIWYAWGDNQYGQLGVGDIAARSSPVAVLGGIKLPRVEIAQSSFGVTEDGTLYAWGRNQNGQLGVGDVTNRSSPVAVLGGKKFIQWFTGYTTECSTFGVERSTGLLYAWGVNTSGRLGVGDVTPRSSPVAVLGSHKFAKVAVGLNSNIGLKSDGTLYAWGVNTNGQLGVGDVTPRSSPVAVLGGLTFKDIVTLGDSYLALKSDGTLYAWGVNGSGQLGVGDVTPRSSPVAVLTTKKFSKIAANQATLSVVAMEEGTGSLYAWGSNSKGQLGVGDVAHRSSPVLVLGSSYFSEILMGELFAYGFANDGKVYAWGDNQYGQLGLGDVTARSSPVAVMGLAPLSLFPEMTTIQVTSGNSYAIQLCGGKSLFGNTDLGSNVRRITIAYED